MARDREIHAVDTHVCGEPGRVIIGGIDDVPGSSMLEKMRHIEREEDWLRRAMLREPRGYPAANCNVILPPTEPAADAGYVIMEQVEYPLMSGTNTIAVTTVLIETGGVRVEEPVTELTLESPAGLIDVRAEVANGKVRDVTFRNQPAFATHLDAEIDVPELGKVRVDVAWGGMFYVIADAATLEIEIAPQNGGEIARVGEMIKVAAREQLTCAHPENPAAPGITIAQLSGEPTPGRSDRRNAVIVSTGTLDWDRPTTWTGALDRSPCGTGTCAKMAALHARGELPLGKDFRHEGVLGTVFTGRLVERTRVGSLDAVVPTIAGRAWITGHARYIVDPLDPFPEGFTVGDIWGG